MRFTGGAEGDRHRTRETRRIPCLLSLATVRCVATVCNRVNARGETFHYLRLVAFGVTGLVQVALSSSILCSFRACRSGTTEAMLTRNRGPCGTRSGGAARNAAGSSEAHRGTATKGRARIATLRLPLGQQIVTHTRLTTDALLQQHGSDRGQATLSEVLLPGSITMLSMPRAPGLVGPSPDRIECLP